VNIVGRFWKRAYLLVTVEGQTYAAGRPLGAGLGPWETPSDEARER
jgi:hypothetical protein